MRNHSVFSLIGGVKLSEALNQILINLPKEEDWNSDLRLISADYSAATDNLHPRLIDAAAREVLNHFDIEPLTAQTYLKSLQSHTIHYDTINLGDKKNPDFPFKDSLPIDQTWGQLMGSPSSFPILCLINAAICRYVIELSFKKTLQLSECPLLINGDDAGFVINKKDYETWWQLVSQAGLEPSSGKNYSSPDFLMLNSELHLFKKKQTEGIWERYFRYVPFTNIGLIAGKSKVLSDTRNDLVGVFYDPKSTSEEVVRGFEGKQKNQLITWYLSKAKDNINKASYKGQSWFLPRQLGGLGIPTEQEVKLSRGQAKLAAYLAVCPAVNHKVPKPLTSNDERASYTTLAAVQEKKVKDHFETVWVEGKDPELIVDLDVSFKRHFTATQFSTVQNDQWRTKTSIQWDTLWKKGTNHNISMMTWQQSKEFRSKTIGYMRPSLTSSQHDSQSSRGADKKGPSEYYLFDVSRVYSDRESVGYRCYTPGEIRG